MVIYQFKYDGETDTVFGPTKEDCIQHWLSETGIPENAFEAVEVPESEWDTRYVSYKEEGLRGFKQSFKEEVKGEVDSRIIASTAYN